MTAPSASLPPLERRMPSGLSPSSIDLWFQCPAKFEKEKVERRKDPVPTGDAAVLGTAVHLVLDKLFNLPPQHRTLEQARNLTQLAWRETILDPEFAALTLTPAQVLEFRRSVWTSVRNYWNIEDPASIVVRSTEQEVKAVIRGIPLRGRVDRVSTPDPLDLTDVVIEDYKNGKVPERRYRAPKLRQLNLYAAMIAAMDRTVTPVLGRLIFTAHAEVIETRITRGSMDDAVSSATEAWVGLHAAEKAGDYVAQPGPLCGWCAFAAECPEGLAFLRMLRSKGKLRTDAPAYPLAAPLPVAELDDEAW